MKLFLFNRLVFAACSMAGISGVAPLHGGTVLYDLSNVHRAESVAANTFARGATDLRDEGGSLIFGMGINSYLVAAFPQVELSAAGDSLQATLRYKPSDVRAFSISQQALRVGLFSSEKNAVQSDGTTVAAEFRSYTGVSATMRTRAGENDEVNTFYQRQRSDHNLWASESYDRLEEAPTLPQVALEGAEILLRIERLEGDVLRYTISYDTATDNHVTLEVEDAQPPTFEFDAFSFFATPVIETAPYLEITELSIVSSK